MFLKNYTSDVPVSQTLYRIEQTLIKCGVTGITKEYVDTEGHVSAVTFHIEVAAGRSVAIRLPANVDGAMDAFWKDYVGSDKHDGQKITDWNSRKRRNRSSFREQAERTAWKIVQDWVEVQMSMIQMQQAEWVQVFLPYVWDGQRTIYDRAKADGFRFMLPENGQTR